MGGYARALGVRCEHCHVEEEVNGVERADFAADDKAPKRVAREMMRMVASINAQLDSVPELAGPRVRVQCMTCHRGAARPHMLPDTLLIAYDNGGVTSMTEVYRALRERWFGRATWDFGERSLAEVGAALLERERYDDAAAAYALNVEVNPASDFAVREHGRAAVLRAFVEDGAVAGTREYRRLRELYGARAFPGGVLNRVGYDLLALEAAQDAVAVFRLNADAYPNEGNVHDSLGEGLLAAGDTAGAIASYRRAAELDPRNTDAAETAARLERLLYDR